MILGLLRFLGRVLLWGAVLSVLFGLWGMWKVYSNLDQTFTETADCGVVFGAAVWKDDIPSHALSDRMQAGIGLYKNNQISCLILSGGPSTYGAHEVDAMAKMAEQYSIPTEKIKKDYSGTNTQETITNLANNGTSYVFISQAPHLGRISLLANKADITDFSLHSAIPIRWQRSAYDDFFWNEVGKTLFYSFWVPSAQ